MMPHSSALTEIVSGGMNQLTGVPPSAFPPSLSTFPQLHFHTSCTWTDLLTYSFADLYDFHANSFSGGFPPELMNMFPRMGKRVRGRCSAYA